MGTSIISALAALTGTAVGGLMSYSAALDMVWTIASGMPRLLFSPLCRRCPCSVTLALMIMTPLAEELV
jgi:hypothetical protein